MKHTYLFVIAICIGALVFILYDKILVQKTIQTPESKPQQVTQSPFLLDTAPSQSLRGSILSSKGNIEWQSRTATEASVLTNPVSLQQGEEVSTQEKASMTIQFPGVSTTQLNPQTHILFAQTLPDSFVVVQDKGEAVYTKLGANPVSIRSLHLLTKLNEGQVTISLDKTALIVTLLVTKGSVTIAYNDRDNLSNVVTVKQGDKVMFDDEKRKVGVR